MKRATNLVAAIGLSLSASIAAQPLEAKTLHKPLPRQTKKIESKQRVTKTQLNHPKGCPKTLFCGCGTAVEIFGAPIRALWVAANWFRFPKAQPAPGMVAVRKHHVFKIEKVLDNNTVIARNHNGTNHKSYIQVMTLNGYSVRNPKG